MTSGAAFAGTCFHKVSASKTQPLIVECLKYVPILQKAVVGFSQGGHAQSIQSPNPEVASRTWPHRGMKGSVAPPSFQRAIMMPEIRKSGGLMYCS